MERLWSRSYIAMFAANLVLFIAFYSLYPTLPLFIQQMGGSEAAVGLSMGVFMLASVLLRPLIGGLLDRFGRRPFVVAGLLLFMASMLLYPWAGGLAALMALRLLHGTSWAASSTATQTVVTDMIPPARRGEGLGWYGMTMTFAMAVGPAFGLWLIGAGSYAALFLTGAALSAAALLMTFGAQMPFQPGGAGDGPLWARIEVVEKPVLPLAASVFFLFAAYAGITTFVPLFAASLQASSGTFFLVYAATLALSRPLAGRLSDRYHETAIVLPALLITVLALVVLSLATGLAGLLVAAVLYGIGFGSAHPVLHAATIRLARPDRKGVANATFSTAIDLGIGLGAILLGWIVQLTGYRGLFLVSAASVAVCLVVFLFVRRTLVAAPHPADTGGAA